MGPGPAPAARRPPTAAFSRAKSPVNARARRVRSARMTEPNQPNVVDLVDAGVPADQGLSSLGMLMQLAGNLFAAYMSLTTFAMLVLSSRTGSGNETLWVLLLLGAAITRSLVHRSAGAQLLYGVGG